MVATLIIDTAHGPKEAAATIELDAFIVAAHGPEVAAAAIELEAPRSNEMFPSVASPTLMCFEVDVGGASCSWNRENEVSGPHLSPEPSIEVVTAKTSCGPVEDLLRSSGLDCNFQLASTSETTNTVGLGEATAWNSPGQTTVLCSFRSQPVAATDILFRPHRARHGAPPPLSQSSSFL
jgi:hypothetical protein